MHISNRHLERDGVVAGIAHANGLKAWSFDGESRTRTTTNTGSHPPSLSRPKGPTAFGLPLAADKDWKPRDPDAGERVWADDYSNVFGVLRWA